MSTAPRRRNTAARLLLPFLLLAALVACNRTAPQEGLYYWGAEVNVICRCNTDSCYWVRGGAEVVDRLKNYVQRQTSRPYQPVYVQYRGEMLDEQTFGFAVNYEGYQALHEVLSVTTVLPDHCPAP